MSGRLPFASRRRRPAAAVICPSELSQPAQPLPPTTDPLPPAAMSFAAPTAAEVAAARRLRGLARHEGFALSDFELLQFSIVAKGDTANALRRIRRLAALRAKHRVDDLEAEAVLSYIARNVAGFVQSIGRDAAGRGHLIVLYSAFDPSALVTPEDWRLHVAASLAVLDAVAGDSLETVRAGVVIVADCYGSGWRNFSQATQASFINLYQNAYPVLISGLAIVDAPRVISALLQLCKSLLSRKMMNKILQLSKDDVPAAVPLPQRELPPAFGGTFAASDLIPCIRRRLATRAANIAAVVL
jgi:CRAL/TRIO domain